MTEKDRFQASSRSGVRYEIVEYQHWTTYQPLEGPAQRHKGPTEFFTSDGKDVNRNADGSFTVVLTDEVLNRI
jgi:hypothetical protein